MDDQSGTTSVFSELRRRSRQAWLNAVALAQRQRDPFTPGLRVGIHWRLASNRLRPDKQAKATGGAGEERTRRAS